MSISIQKKMERNCANRTEYNSFQHWFKKKTYSVIASQWLRGTKWQIKVIFSHQRCRDKQASFPSELQDTSRCPIKQLSEKDVHTTSKKKWILSHSYNPHPPFWHQTYLPRIYINITWSTTVKKKKKLKCSITKAVPCSSYSIDQLGANSSFLYHYHGIWATKKPADVRIKCFSRWKFTFLNFHHL